ncbi:MAG: type II toxin-antitoxin system VapC family toxin [bacterium]
MKYLIDTCVISEFTKKSPNQDVIAWLKYANEEGLYLSVLTMGELQRGITKLPESKRKENLIRWLDDLRIRFRGRIIEIDEDIVVTWGKTTGDLEKTGIVLPAIDGLIAATAKTHNMAIITRNVSDFEKSGVDIVNPWHSE